MSDRNRFESRTVGHDEWLTPKWITDALGPFDLDPCSPVNRPWDTATKHLNVNDDGFNQEWEGFVWCNPPYGKQTYHWMKKMAEHNNGIAMIFARTETRNFRENIWQKATSIVFLHKRISFLKVDGSKGVSTAGCPSVLIGYGETADKRLADAIKEGKIDGTQLKIK